jgi:hypothetical protein
MSAEKLVEEKLAQLRAQSFDQLHSAESYHCDKINCGRKRKILLTVWKDEPKPNQVRIVVQAYRPLILGLGTMTAKGFIARSSGQIRDLEQRELYEFL